MSLEIVLGKAKSGKSKFIFENIVEDIKNGMRPILFVPSQTRVIAEENYMDSLKIDGIMGVNVTTISEFVSGIMKSLNLHFDDNFISKLDKKIILTQIVRENEELFRVFKRVRNKQGFFDLLCIYMDIFRKENIDVDKISALNLKNKVLENKLKEICKIYEKYLEKVNNKYIDNVDEVDILSKNMQALKWNLNGCKVYFDGYNNFTRSEFKFIKLLLMIGKDCKITIKTDIENIEDIEMMNTNEIFEISNNTYVELLQIAALCGVNVDTKVLYNNYSSAKKELVYLADNVFGSINFGSNLDFSNSIYLNVYQNVYKEVESIAYNICKKIREGAKYSDFCIYTTDMDNYSSVFSRVFYEYNIPFYANSKKNIEDTKLTQYILNVIKIGVSGINIESLISILKLGLNEIDEIDFAYFENYIKEFNINKYSLNKKFYLNNDRYNETIYDLDRLNGIREKMIDIFSDISSLIKEKMTAKEIVTIIYNHLISRNILEKYNRYFDDIQDKAYYVYSVNIKDQVWDKLCGIFDSICKIYGENKLDLGEFFNLFKMTIKDVTLKTIPPTKDKVMVIDINVSKVDMKKYVFFVGVVEGSFPKKTEQDIFFSDYEIESLSGLDIKFKETSLSKENMGLYNIYEALTNVEKELYITMPSTDISSKSTRKSSFMLLVQNTTGLKLMGEVSSDNILDIKYDDIYSKEKAFEYMVCKIKEYEEKLNELKNLDNIDLEKILSIYNYFIKDEEYGKIIDYIKDDSDLSKESVDKIYQDTLKSSVYKLEMFKSCPFSYYMKYVLNISKDKVFDITSMDTGSFMHDVLENFSMYLFKKNIFWHEIIKDENNLKDEYKEVLFGIVTKMLDEKFKKQKENVKYTIYKQKLTNTLKKVMVVIARGFNQSEFTPYGYELEFKDKGDLLPIEIKLDNDKSMKIVGKIDRIDTVEFDDKVYARVVDYKSSGKTITVDKIKDGISLQLITYLLAFVDSKNKLNGIMKNGEGKQVIPSATLYFDLSDKLLNLKDYTNDDSVIQKEILKRLRMNGLFLKDVKVLEKMDNKVNDSDKKLIDVSPNRASKKLLDEKEFENLCEEVKIILKNIGNEIIKGTVKISPSKKSKPCEYCDFSNVCRKNICL